MNAHTPRQSPAEHEDATELFSRTARDLPAGRHQFHKERLMAQIQQEQHVPTTAAAQPRRKWLMRPAIALPVIATAVAGAFFALSLTQGQEAPGGGLGTGPALTTPVGAVSTKGLPQLVDQIAVAAGEESHPKVGPGQYIYIESRGTGTFVKVDHGKSSLVSHDLSTRQVWESADGTRGWLIDPRVNEGPEGETLSLPDEQGNTPEATLNAPSYDYLAALTTDPDELLAKIYKETEGMGNSPDQQAFTTIGDLLGESYPPAKLYPALFKAAAKIPGVVVVNDAVDAAGRHGVAVAREDHGVREEWIFDKKTHVYLGQRSVQVSGTSGEDGLIKPGTVISTSAVMKRAVVDEMKEVPRG
ncbi:CU044_5270 family protein [Streptomyces sp. NPDC005017]|uniref:CU044_5270 family protein n=1 Tax=Streptomyces sp. NPDC005017 TaxID=3364706 RepID=UPI0036B85875